MAQYRYVISYYSDWFCQKLSLCLPAIFSLATGKNATTQSAPWEGRKAGCLAVWTLHNTKSICRASAGAQYTSQAFNAAFPNAGILEGSPGVSHWGWNQTFQFKIRQHQNRVYYFPVMILQSGEYSCRKILIYSFNEQLPYAATTYQVF